MIQRIKFKKASKKIGSQKRNKIIQTKCRNKRRIIMINAGTSTMRDDNAVWSKSVDQQSFSNGRKLNVKTVVWGMSTLAKSYGLVPSFWTFRNCKLDQTAFCAWVGRVKMLNCRRRWMSVTSPSRPFLFYVGQPSTLFRFRVQNRKTGRFL